MTRMRELFTCFLPLMLATVLLHGCATSMTAKPKEPNLRSVAGELSKLEGMIDYWGTASISEVLYMEDNGQFKLDYDQKVSDYVDKARASYQGAARRFFQKAEETQTATTTEVDAVQAAKAALTGGPQGAAALDLAATAAGQLGVKGLGPDTAESYGIGEVMKSAPAIESKLQANTAKGVLNSDRFSNPYALADAPGGISERQALMIGANDKITENILKYLAHPTGVPDNKIVLLGILQVSCNPGSGTREGYMADMLITPEYDRYQYPCEEQRNKDIDNPTLDPYYHSGVGAIQPTVLAAFPLLEAQTLDLRNSEREQQALSAYIASLIRAQGQSQQNESLNSMAERLETDSATRSPVPTVVSYTNGDCVGFQFMPRFEALTSPEKKERGSGKVLYPYSFPALVLLSIDTEDLQPVQDPCDPSKKILPHDAIRLNVTTRWVPIEKSKFGSKHVFDSNTRLAMAEQLEHLTQTYNAITIDPDDQPDDGVNDMKSLKAIKPSGPHRSKTGPNYVHAELARRMRVVEPRALGKTVISPLPKSIQEALNPPPYQEPKVPVITGLYADRGWVNAPTLIGLTGEQLSKNKISTVKSVSVNGRACEFVPAGAKTLLVIVPPIATDEDCMNASGKPTKHVLTLVTTQGITQHGFNLAFDQCVRPSDEPSLTLSRDSKGSVTSVKFNPNVVTDPLLLDFYQDILTDNGTLTLEGARIKLEQK